MELLGAMTSFQVKYPRRGYVDADLRLVAPLLTVGNRLDPVLYASAVLGTDSRARLAAGRTCPSVYQRSYVERRTREPPVCTSSRR